MQCFFGAIREESIVTDIRSEGSATDQVGMKRQYPSLGRTRGFTNAVNKGLIGQKTYDLNNVSGVQYKKPGFTTGYLQIVLIGGRDARNGVSGAVKDENSITFSKKEDHLILEIKEYIENYIHKRSTGSATSSNLDEIRTLKELLDIGAITDEEFEAKKAQLLNL